LPRFQNRPCPNCMVWFRKRRFCQSRCDLAGPVLKPCPRGHRHACARSSPPPQACKRQLTVPVLSLAIASTAHRSSTHAHANRTSSETLADKHPSDRRPQARLSLQLQLQSIITRLRHQPLSPGDRGDTSGTKSSSVYSALENSVPLLSPPSPLAPPILHLRAPLMCASYHHQPRRIL
jgi:hypothetical protein